MPQKLQNISEASVSKDIGRLAYNFFRQFFWQISVIKKSANQMHLKP